MARLDGRRSAVRAGRNDSDDRPRRAIKWHPAEMIGYVIDEMIKYYFGLGLSLSTIAAGGMSVRAGSADPQNVPIVLVIMRYT